MGLEKFCTDVEFHIDVPPAIGGSGPPENFRNHFEQLAFHKTTAL